MMRRYMVREIGVHRGAPRIYLDTAALAIAGFTPGAAYQRETTGGRVVLRLDVNGRFKVSRKEKEGKIIPVIDINSKEALSPLDGLKAVRLVIADGVCPRRSKFEPPCRLNIEPGVEADFCGVGCG